MTTVACPRLRRVDRVDARTADSGWVAWWTQRHWERSATGTIALRPLQVDGCTALHHGTLWAYRAHKCRCVEAVELANAKGRARSAAKRNPNAVGQTRSGRGEPVDEVAVERAMAGDPVLLSAVERHVAVARLTASPHNLSAVEIARRLRVSDRTVVRYRGRQLPAAA